MGRRLSARLFLGVVFALAGVWGGLVLAQDSVKIGFIAPLTGPAAVLGESSYKGARLAVEAINATGGIKGKKVELVAADTGGDPAQAGKAAELLVRREGVIAIVGDVTSAGTLAASHSATGFGVPQITAYAIGIGPLEMRSPYFFRLTPSLPSIYKAMGALAGGKLALRRCVVFTLSTEMGRANSAGFAEGFQKEGQGRVVLDVPYEPLASEFTAALASLKKANPDCVVLTGLGRDSGLIAKAVRELGINVRILGSLGQSALDFKEAAGAASEGVMLLVPYDPFLVKTEKALEFRDVWKAKYKYEPDYIGASSYDAVWMVADAAKKGGMGRQDVARVLSSAEFKGASGKIKMVPLGETRRDLVIQIWEGGRLVGKEIVEAPKPAS